MSANIPSASSTRRVSLKKVRERPPRNNNGSDFHTTIDQDLFLPEAWDADRERCRERRIVHSKTPSLQGGGGLGDQVERRGRKSFGNAEQGESGMKALSFFGAFFILGEEAGDDSNLVASEQEDVDVPPAPNAKRRFLREDREFFF